VTFQGPGERWRRVAIALMVPLAAFLLWRGMAEHRNFVSMLPLIFAAMLALWAMFDWLKASRKD
jgi:hypothetical protein